MAMLMTATSYFPIMIHETERDVMAIAPKPDSIPLSPANMLVRLEAMETAKGMDNM